MTGRWAGRIAYRLRRRTPTPSPAPFLDGALVSAAGWCAPSAAVYDAAALDTNVFTAAFVFPEVTVTRRAIIYEPPTAAQRAASAAYAVFVRRTAERLAAFRAEAVDAACVTALAHGYDVHVYDPPVPLSMDRATDADLARLRRVGIAFTPAAHPVPTITQHPAPDAWEWDDDYDLDDDR